jgi:histidine triad (HIT) family protein
MDCVFCKIVKKELPAKVLYEDDDVIAFPDINPVKPVHLLVIPKEHIPEISEVPSDLLVKVFDVVKNMAKREGLSRGKGYRIGINAGGAEAVPHFHVHLIGPMKNTEGM